MMESGSVAVLLYSPLSLPSPSPVAVASARCFPSSSPPPPHPARWLSHPTPLRLPRRPRLSRMWPPRCGKMYVPGFGEASPEAKAAKNLQDFFTFLAVKIVLAQLQSYNPEAYGELRGFLDQNPLDDGDNFCRALMRESPRHKDLALRILEVRSAYSKKDFEWDNLKKLAFKLGLRKEAYQIVGEMRKNGLKPDAVTWRVLEKLHGKEREGFVSCVRNLESQLSVADGTRSASFIYKNDKSIDEMENLFTSKDTSSNQISVISQSDPNSIPSLGQSKTWTTANYW